MRVLLADGPNHCLRRGAGSMQVHPLGIGYVAALLAPAHDVLQLVPDVRDYGGADPWPFIDAAIADAAPDVLGISCVTATYPAARALAQRARAILGPDVPIVMGGVHPTFRTDDAFAIPEVDFVVRGEGEHTMRALVDALEAGVATDHIPGLLRRGANGAVVRGPERAPFSNLDELPFPRREGVLWPDQLHPAFYQSIITLRGCPYRCIYCAIPASADKKTRYRSAQNVAEEVAFVRHRYNVPYIFFHDSVFTLNRKRTVELLDRLAEMTPHVPFACQTRTDRVDPELLELMVAAGCHQIFFGIESGHPESLKRIRKGMPLADIRQAVGWAKALGIRCTGFFMVGFPWETEPHIRATADFATGLDLDAVSLFSATPLPGTELWDLSVGVDIPESIDFRKPEINLTQLTPDAYARLYNEVEAQLADYNRGRMNAQALAHWPRG